MVRPYFEEVEQRLQIGQERHSLCFIQRLDHVFLRLPGTGKQSVSSLFVAEHFKDFVLNHFDPQVQEQCILCHLSLALLGSK